MTDAPGGFSVSEPVGAPPPPPQSLNPSLNPSLCRLSRCSGNCSWRWGCSGWA